MGGAGIDAHGRQEGNQAGGEGGGGEAAAGVQDLELES